MNVRTLMTLCVALTVAAAVSAGERGLMTQVIVEVGAPVSGQEGPAVELLPGTVISVGPSRQASASAYASWVLEHVALDEQLAETFRIRMIKEKSTGKVGALQPGESLELEPAGGAVEVQVRLTALDGDLASYRVAFLDHGRELSVTPVSVKAGARAVVGARDGEAAPYLFVVLEPVWASNESPVRFFKGSGLVEPKKIKAVRPAYPESARKDKVQGVVVLSVVVTEAGSVGRVATLKSPDARLTAAAEDAVRQWKFEPARDADGNPIAVEYTLATRFVLQ